ncbi:restriction endonuclease subunit S [Pseudomonas frederiksbergensis]|uniref:restriction endonuclease subunit S n=1 Tax=Pseudomonas frederiksbergensis TaxID=104087 RepID=UPI000A74FF50|nr:restriction endonuclease subunit S [Pseudomonas frederiksbergensis]
MVADLIPFTELLSTIVDNRGRTCPVGDTGLPLIATNCISNDSLYPKYETTRFVNDETHRTWFRGHPQPGDILFVCKGSPGRTNLVPDPVDFCIAQDMVAVRADPKKVYPKYLLAVLRSSYVQNQIDNMHVGTLIPHFKKGDFDKLQIPVLDHASQKLIGDTYFLYSKKIELNRRMSLTLEAMAFALFKSWFVDFDDVLLEDMQESELGLIPKMWRVGTLTDLAVLNPEAWTKQTRPDEIRYVDLSNTKWGHIESVTPYKAKDAPSRAQRVLRPNDTIVGTVRPGNGSYALIGENGLTGSTGFAVLRPKRDEYAALVYLAAVAPDNIDVLANLADGGAYPAVRAEVVAATRVVIADEETIARFAQCVSPLLEKIAKNERQSRTLAELRDTLLPKLISGKLRVRDAERFQGETT